MRKSAKSKSVLEHRKRKSTKHGFEMSHRVTRVTSRIHDLELRLAATLGHFDEESEILEIEDDSANVEPETVTTCVINICSTRRGGRSRSDSEVEVGVAEEEQTLKAPVSFYRHPFPEGFKYKSIVPRSRADWLQFLVWLVKQRLIIKYLTDTKLKRVIEIARGQIGRVPDYEDDPDIPECYYWDEEQVGNWVAEVGHPELRNAFLENYINGRRLAGVDASALNKMGIKNWKVIQDMSRNIRCMFGLPRPNIMRPLGRQQPYETFLTRHRIHNGRTYDLLTFKEFCKKNEYDYEDVIEAQTKNAYMCAIPDGKIIDAPSVEFQVRHQFIRSQTLETIIHDLIQLIFVPPGGTPTDGISYVDALIDRILNTALLKLGFGDPQVYTRQSVKYAAELALTLLAEMPQTSDVVSDINRLKAYLKMDVTLEEMDAMREASGAFMEDLAPIAALLALNQLSLEGIFRQEPEFEHFVDEIVKEAEDRANEALPCATVAVGEVIDDAKVHVLAHKEYPYQSISSVREAEEVSFEISEDIVTKAVSGGTSENTRTEAEIGRSGIGDQIVLPVLVSTNEGTMTTVFEGKALIDQNLSSPSRNISDLKPRFHEPRKELPDTSKISKILQAGAPKTELVRSKISVSLGQLPMKTPLIKRPQSASVMQNRLPNPAASGHRKRTTSILHRKLDDSINKAKAIWKEATGK